MPHINSNIVITGSGLMCATLGKSKPIQGLWVDDEAVLRVTVKGRTSKTMRQREKPEPLIELCEH